MSLAKQIKDANDFPLTPVSVPEWGCQVYMRPLSCDAKFKAQQAIARGQNGNLIALVDCLCNEEGQPIYSDVRILGQKNSQVVDRLIEEMVNVSGMGSKAVDEKKDNSEPIQNAASS